MSMIGIFIPVTEQELKEYINDSSLLEARLDAGIEEEDPGSFEIDKSWDALSYLLTGFTAEDIHKAAPPLSWTIFGAHVLDENQDLGYGPANYLTAEEVKELDTVLSGIPVSQLTANYDGKKMNALEIYPGIWDDEKVIGYLTSYFEELKEFYARTAVNGQAVITYLS